VSALPGKFELADKGTVFLDEIGDMSADLQAALLRVLQDNEIKPLGGNTVKRVDVRIISATNKDLRQAMDDGEFREDLFFRLNVLPVVVPPLRERVEDVPYLLTHFIRRESVLLGMEPKHVSPEALDILQSYPWPGNVREMENMVKLILVSGEGEVIQPEDLPPAVLDADPAPRPDPAAEAAAAGGSWEDVEREYASRLLKKHHWIISRAAREAGLKRSTFDSRLKKLGIRKTPA
jgi:transcriptional regulator with GAF, ATPase, and Fis domain